MNVAVQMLGPVIALVNTIPIRFVVGALGCLVVGAGLSATRSLKTR